MGINLCLLALAIQHRICEDWHPSRSSPSISRVAPVQLPKLSPVVFQVLCVAVCSLVRSFDGARTDARCRPLSTRRIPPLLWFPHHCGLPSVRRSGQRSNRPLQSHLHSVLLSCAGNFGQSCLTFLLAEEVLHARLHARLPP